MNHHQDHDHHDDDHQDHDNHHDDHNHDNNDANKSSLLNIAVLDRMVSATTGTAASSSSSSSAHVVVATTINGEEERPLFLKSATWQGFKEGYYFGTSKQYGTGYHLDSYQQSQSHQPPHQQEDEDEESLKPPFGKKARFMPTSSTLSGQELLEQVERNMDPTDFKFILLELTPKGIKNAIVALKKLYTRNQLQRVQYSDEPEKFMESEIHLFQQLQSLSAIATTTDPSTLYPLLLRPPTLPSSSLPSPSQEKKEEEEEEEKGMLEELMIPLLSHDNVDIAMTVIQVWNEWIDVESTTTTSSPSPLPPLKEIMLMANAIIQNDGLKWTIANLGRLDPNVEEEATGIDSILTLTETLLELSLIPTTTTTSTTSAHENDENENGTSSVATRIVKDTSLVSWLLQQIETQQSSRAAEVLSLLFQQSEVFSILPDLTQIPPYTSPLVDEPSSSSSNNNNNNNKPMDGMEILLQAIALYRKKQPESEDQCDFLENVGLALASCVTFSEINIQNFLDRQGIELVLRCLKERVHAGGVTFQLLELQSRRACEQLVQAGGLKYVFPIFMGRAIPKPISTYASKKNERKEWWHRLETQSIQIIYALTRHLTPDSPQDAMERLLVKFAEDDCEKCQRLVELLLKYDQKATMAEYKFYRNRDDDDDDDDDIELAALHAKLKGGGDLFHRVGAIAAFCCVGSKKCHRFILDQLTLQQSGIGVIKAALEEFASVLDDGEQKVQLLEYLQRI